MRKKVCCFILSLLLCFGGEALGAAGASSPESTVLNAAVFEVTSLGIMSGDENGELHVDETMTRAEFAKALTLLQGCDEIDYSAALSDFYFPDVSEEHWAKNYIRYAVSSGVMRGDTSGVFRPDDSITLQEAAKSLVCLLGYEVAAIEDGGYPAGYLKTARRNGFFDHVMGGLEDPARRGDIIIMIYNCLDVPFLVSNYADEPQYEKDINVTIRENIMRQKDLFTMSGIVSANYRVWLQRPTPAITESQVEIDGMLFEAGETNAQSFIGQQVQIYYKQSEDMKYPCIYNIAPTRNNDIVHVAPDMVTRFTKDDLEFEADNSAKRQKYKFKTTTKFIYNNRVVSGFLEEFSKIENGEVILLSNDGTRTADYVFVFEYEDYVLESISDSGSMRMKKLELANGVADPVYMNVLIEPELNETYSIEDERGKKVGFGELEKGQTVSVFRNKSDHFLRLIVSQKEAVVGTVTGITGDEMVEIDSERYRAVSDFILDTVRIGGSYRFYFDYQGVIAYYEEDYGQAAYEDYGAIIGVSPVNFGSYQVRILRAGSVENREEKDLADKTNTNTTPITLCSNSAVEVYEVNDKLSVDGSRVTGSEIQKYIGVPIRYYVTSEQRLKRLETLNQTGGGKEVKYNAKEHAFGGVRNIEPFLFDESTRVICLPTNGASDKADLLSTVNLNNKDTSLRYNAQGYERSQETGAVRLFVLQTELDAEKTNQLFRSNSKLGLVSSAALAVNETGEEYLVVEMLSAGEKKTIETRSLSGERSAMKDLRCGDFIFYSEDADGKMDNVIIAENVDSLDESYHIGEYSEEEQLSGFPQELRKNQVDNIPMLKVDELDILTPDFYTAKIEVTNNPEVFLYQKNAKVVEPATLDDIILQSAGGQDRVVLFIPNGKIRAVVIIR